MIDRHLESMILREKGQNQKLAREVLEKLSEEGKERLFRIFQDKELELIGLKSKVKKFGF